MKAHVYLESVPFDKYMHESAIQAGHKSWLDFLSKFKTQKLSEEHYQEDNDEGGEIYKRIECGLKGEFLLRHFLKINTNINLTVDESFRFRSADIHEIGIGVKSYKRSSKFPLISQKESKHQVIIEMPNNLKNGKAIIHGIVFSRDIQKSLKNEASLGYKSKNKKKREFKNFELINSFNSKNELENLLTKEIFMDLMKPFKDEQRRLLTRSI